MAFKHGLRDATRAALANTALSHWFTPAFTKGETRKSALWRRDIVAVAGGSCQLCGFTPQDISDTASMDFHHRDPALKLFTMTTNHSTKAWTIVKAEMDKCDLLCANCHRKVHRGEKRGKRTQLEVAKLRLHESLARVFFPPEAA
jgi:predicted HNH restriction endonuclease